MKTPTMNKNNEAEETVQTNEIPAVAPVATCCASLTEMSRDERSLLLYLETRAVDHGGLVTTPQMNATDFENVEKWKAVGFIEFGRLTHESIEKLRGSTHWVKLSEKAWLFAHQERRNRYERVNGSRTWQTTEEKRSRHNTKEKQ